VPTTTRGIRIYVPSNTNNTTAPTRLHAADLGTSDDARATVTLEDDRRESFLGLSVTQILGGALAAATSALAASFLGVAGMIIGAVVGSVVATVGSAIYAQSLRTAGVRLRMVRVQAFPAGASPGPATLSVPGPPAGRPPRARVRLVVGIALAVIVALAGITGVERLLGHPLSSSSTSGTSIGQAVTGNASQRTVDQGPATPADTDTSTPSGTPSAPTSTGTATGTATTTPPATATATATATTTATASSTEPDTATSTPSTPAPSATGAVPVP
jgi:hypothetical protein